MNNVVEERTNGNQSQRVKGVLQSVGSQSIPKEFITSNKDIGDALAKTIFRDEKQKNDFNLYYDQLKLFFDDTDDEIRQFVYLLNSASAVGGKGREQALEGHTGMLRMLTELKNKEKEKAKKQEYQPNEREAS